MPCSHTVCQTHSLPHSPWQCLHTSFSLLKPPVHPPLDSLAVTDLAFYFTEKTQITKNCYKLPHIYPSARICTTYMIFASILWKNCLYLWLRASIPISSHLLKDIALTFCSFPTSSFDPSQSPPIVYKHN